MHGVAATLVTPSSVWDPQRTADTEPEDDGRLMDALRRCELAIASHPDDPAAHNARGNVLLLMKRYEDAIASLDKAIALQPAFVEAHSNRGNAVLSLRRFQDAIESYDKVIAINPDDAEVLSNRGYAFRKLWRFAEALESYERAVTLMPDRAELYSNRGNVLQELERLEEAIEDYDTALRLNPGHAETYSNRGAALMQLKRIREAAANFDMALRLRPDYPEVMFSKAIMHIMRGEFAIGWRQYEARKTMKRPVGNRFYAKPLWLGDQEISGKTILVHCEQGFGDVLWLCRYVILCVRAGARVLFAPLEPLKTLMRGLQAKISIVDANNDHLLFDYHCPLMSLPLAFRTELATIPRERYLSADEEKVTAWAHRLGKKTRPRIGVVWGRDERAAGPKTIPLELFQRLFDPRFEFVSLQKHLTEAERERLDRSGVRHPGEALFDFSDTAALCCLMDLVISIDTSVAHLAGALAVPVWVLLPWFSGWPWMLDREDSPWYPSARLFRQPMRGDWDAVLRRVRSELQSLFFEDSAS